MILTSWEEASSAANLPAALGVEDEQHHKLDTQRPTARLLSRGLPAT